MYHSRLHFRSHRTPGRRDAVGGTRQPPPISVGPPAGGSRRPFEFELYELAQVSIGGRHPPSGFGPFS